MRTLNKTHTSVKYVKAYLIKYCTQKYRPETATYIIGLPIQRKYYNSEDLTLHKIKGWRKMTIMGLANYDDGGLANDTERGDDVKGAANYVEWVTQKGICKIETSIVQII